MKRLALISICLLLATSAATAATPAAYRAHVNRICSGYTPGLEKLAAQMDGAEAAGKQAAWRAAVVKFLNLSLQQNVRIEVVRIPSSLAPKMKPILRRMTLIDGHIRLALRDAKSGDTKAMISELLTIGGLRTPLNHALTVAGLKDCAAIKA